MNTPPPSTLDPRPSTRQVRWPFLVGFLAALCLAAVSPTMPPTRLAPGTGITITTNGLNNFTISGGGVGTNNLNPNQFEAGTTNVNIKSGALLTNTVEQATAGNAVKWINAAGTQKLSFDEYGNLDSRGTNNLSYLTGTNGVFYSSGTNALRTSDGTAALPAYSFISDPTIGFYNAGGQLAEVQSGNLVAYTAIGGKKVLLYAVDVYGTVLTLNAGAPASAVSFTSTSTNLLIGTGGGVVGMTNATVTNLFVSSLTNSTAIKTESPYTVATTAPSLNAWTTNGTQRALVFVSIEAGNTLTTDVAKVTLRSENATWTNEVVFQPAIALVTTNVDTLSCAVDPAGRFVISNLSSGSATVRIVTGSYAQVKQ